MHATISHPNPTRVAVAAAWHLTLRLPKPEPAATRGGRRSVLRPDDGPASEPRVGRLNNRTWS